MKKEPTWTDDIQYLFSSPYWIDKDSQASVGAEWRDAMKGYFVYLDEYESVKNWSVQIYSHLHSRSMPLSPDPNEQWPSQALESFRIWANQGYRQTSHDPLDIEDRIPLPVQRPLALRIRKDITKMTLRELNLYRAKIESLQVDNPLPSSPWQQIAFIHTNWCLHYQEAFLFWHRANLLWLEEQFGMGIPYWNWMSPDVATPGNPAAGLPQAFLDETYVNPHTQERRPNPLRYAAAMNGCSKACSQDPLPGPDCLWVQRDPIFAQAKPDKQELQDKLDQLLTYQDQVRTAFGLSNFSTPQGFPGFPWANIPSFPAPDSDYPYLNQTFDGTYEQPHDNLHGWLGADMADNAYTAFDPVFWSHHSMIDLVYEAWNRKHPATVYTANFPVQPFIGPLASSINETESRRYLYTTIGDMAKDSRSLGYDYASLPTIEKMLQPSASQGPRLNALFEGVRCTLDSYAIELYLNPPPGELRPSTENPHFALRMTRLGMGLADKNNRCSNKGIQRLVDLTRAAQRLDLSPKDKVQLVMKVIDLRTQKILTEEEYTQLPGFAPRLLWRIVTNDQEQGGFSSPCKKSST